VSPPPNVQLQGGHISHFVLFNCVFPSSSAHASPKFEGRGGEELSSELSRILERACSNKSAVDLKSLSITPQQQCWVLYVDALVRD
jgi:exosome complex component RRP42